MLVECFFGSDLWLNSGNMIYNVFRPLVGYLFLPDGLSVSPINIDFVVLASSLSHFFVPLP